MKYKKLLNNLVLLFAGMSFIACDSSDGDSSSNLDNGGSSGGDTGGNSSNTQRITLAGNTEGTAPIDSNSSPEIRIDGQRLEQMIVRNDGIITVDVPFGSTLEVRFVPASNVIGSVGQVVCIYDNSAPEVVTTGEQAVLPGIPAYSCPLNVGSTGTVELIENPTPEQLGGEYTLKAGETNTVFGSGSLPGFNEGAAISFSTNSITVGGVTYERATDPVFEQAAQIVSEQFTLTEGLEQTQFMYSGTIENFSVFVWAFDGPLAGQIGYASANSNDPTNIAGGVSTFCLSNN